MRNNLERLKKKIKKYYGRFLVSRHGFWFVDIPRTSSSSIRSELGKRFGRVHGKVNVIEKKYATPQLFPDHMPASEMELILGRSIWNRIFKFTFVRDPWERVLSMYCYRQNVQSIPLKWTFSDYVYRLAEATRKTPFFEYHGYRFGASEYILGENGEIIVDFIGKYENRAHDIKQIENSLDIENLGENRIQSAKIRTNHYSEFYTSETKEIIRQLYSKDIKLFDYEFVDFDISKKDNMVLNNFQLID